MGQQEVFDFLKASSGKWFTSKDIANEVKLPVNSIRASLKRLRRHDFIFFRRKYKNSKKRVYRDKKFEYMYKK